MSKSSPKYTTTVHKLVGEGQKSLDGLALIKSLVDLLKTVQEEQTKRAYIKSYRDEAIATLQEKREVIEHYMEHRFAERREALRHHYQVLNRAIDMRNDSVMESALAGILGIIQESPLQDLETFAELFVRPDFALEL